MMNFIRSCMFFRISLLLMFGLQVFTLLGMESQAPTEGYKNYQLFQLVQKIREIARESRNEINKIEKCADNRRVEKSPPSHCHLTTQGLLLVCQEDSFPKYLYTPWGHIQIMEQRSHCSSFWESIAAAQLFFKRIKASIAAINQAPYTPKEDMHFSEIIKLIKPIDLQRIRSITQKNPENRQVCKDLEKEFFKEIATENLRNYIGTNSLLRGHYCEDYAVYRITQVDDMPLPFAEVFASDDEGLPRKTLETTWLEFEKRYKSK